MCRPPVRVAGVNAQVNRPQRPCTAREFLVVNATPSKVREQLAESRRAGVVFEPAWRAPLGSVERVLYLIALTVAARPLGAGQLTAVPTQSTRWSARRRR
jgi:hypothetical protein